MLFIKELKKVCFSIGYILFLGFLIFGWYENFYGVTQKEITAASGESNASYTEIMSGSILEKPDKNADSYGLKNKEVPEKIMSGGTDVLIMEYLKNSYATYPFTYYKEVVLSDKEQNEILSIICEITGLTEKQINNLPDDYFPAINGNIIHFSNDAKQTENGSYTFQSDGSNNTNTPNDDYTKHFISQVSYDRFKELMSKVEDILGSGSSYSIENLKQYYGLSEMTYEEAIEEYNKTIYDDKITNAFARLFCDYITRSVGLYPIFVVVIFWLKDRRNHMNELIDSKTIGTSKLLVTRYLAILTAILMPVILLSFESLIPLIQYSLDTGIVIDILAFIKYIIWWILPTAMIVSSLGMLLTILTYTPLAILVQFIWWFIDSSITSLSGDTNFFTLMIRHNTLNGYEIIKRDFITICLNRGLLVFLSVILVVISVFIYKQKRGGKLDYGYKISRCWRFFKERLLANFQK